jgi:hypothetical protein
MQNPKVIDADGHIYENHEEIEEYFEDNGACGELGLIPYSFAGWLAARLGRRPPGQGHGDET